MEESGVPGVSQPPRTTIAGEFVTEVALPVLVGVIGVGISVAALVISVMSAFAGSKHG